MQVLGIFLIGAALSAILVFLAEKTFPKLGLLDFPQRYKLKRKPLPYPGGLVFLLLGIGIVFIDVKFVVFLPAILVLGGVSFIDDRRPLPAWIRIMVHILVGAGIFFAGVRIEFIGNPFQNTNFELADLPWLSFVLTVGWIVVVQNAMNWFDGVRGLAVGVSGIGFLTLGLLGIVRPELFFDPGHVHLTQANFFLGGCMAGGFWMFWKGKIILGDTGSQVLGFLLAGMAIFSGAKIATTLLVLGLPILDAVFVVFRRVFWDRKSPFQGDLFHLPHNLSRLVGESKAALFLVLLSGVLGSIAVFFSGTGKMVVLGIVGVLILILCGCVYKKGLTTLE